MPQTNQLESELNALLKSNKTLFHLLEDTVFDGIWFWDLDNPNNRWMSEKFWLTLGYKPEEKAHTQEAWESVIHPEDLPLTQKCLSQQTGSTEYPLNRTIRYLHKDGSIIHVQCRCFALKNEQGKPHRMLGVHTDLTDYIDEKNSLTFENLSIKERLHYALEGSQDGVWDWNLTSNEVFYSSRWKSILGYEDNEVENAFSSWEQLLHPDDIDDAKQCVQTFLDNTSIGFETRFRMKHKQGHYVPILSRAKKVDIPKNGSTVPHLIGTHVDLTDIVAIQDKLNQQIELTSTYLNTTSTIMLALDKNANITMLNKKGCEVLGVTEASILGQSWFKQPFLPKEIHAKFKQFHSEFIAEKIDLSEPIDHTLTTANNEVKMFTWSNTLLRNDKDEVIGSLSSAIDITERTRVQQQLEQSEFMLKQAQKLAKIGYYTIDLKANQWSCSTEINEMFGIDDSYSKDIEGWIQIICTEDRQEVHNYFAQEVAAKITEFDKQYRIINQTTNEMLWVHSKATLTFDDNGLPSEMFGTIQNISDQKRTESKLTLASNVYKNANEGIVVTNKQGLIIDVNDAFTEITGYRKEEVLGNSPNILNSGIHHTDFYREMWESIQTTGKWEGEIWNRKKSGETYPEYIRISTIKDANNEVENYLALFSDISLQKGNELKLKKMAHYDPLTGLPNRVLLSDRLNRSIARSDRDKKIISLAFLDLDGFKQINDTFGHEVGDQVLKIISGRYSQQARENDTIARIGGDEFIILLDQVETVEESLSFYDRFLEITRQPIQIKDHHFTISCSIGISYYPQTFPIDSDQLIRQADNAMYQAKLAGKNGYHIFDNEKDQIARERHQKIMAINEAIQKDELVLYYQPKVDMRSNKTVGFEALVRWQHPKKGLLPPIEFLPAIEKSKTSINLDKWVIEQAFKQAHFWVKQGIEYPISVNLGAQILQSYKLIEFLEEMLQKYPEVPTRFIEIEVLETSALEDMKHASALMHTSEALGIKVSIDDFGTGYSSLEYLKNLPASYLKIDQSFVRDMLEDEADLAILTAVIGLAQAFGMETIAEGVETDRHCSRLIELGCFIGQGYGIAKPMPADQVPDWLNQ